MAFPNFTPGAIFSNLSALAGLLTSSLAIDVVAVYNQETFLQVFENARPTSAAVRKYARVMEYPVENGTVIADHKVVLPQTVDMTLLISSGFYASTYNEIEQLFRSATLLTVQTKTGVMRNFIIEGMPHDEKPDMYDNIAMSLRMKEVLLITSPSIYAPAAPANTNTVARGQVTGHVVPDNPAPAATSITRRNSAPPQPINPNNLQPASNPNGGIRGAVISMMKPKTLDAK